MQSVQNSGQQAHGADQPVNSIARRFAPRIDILPAGSSCAETLGTRQIPIWAALSLPLDPLRDCVGLRRSSREALRARVVPPRPRSSTSFAFDLSRSAIPRVAKRGLSIAGFPLQCNPRCHDLDGVRLDVAMRGALEFPSIPASSAEREVVPRGESASRFYLGMVRKLD